MTIRLFFVHSMFFSFFESTTLRCGPDGARFVDSWTLFTMKTLNITKPAIRKLFFVRSPWSLGGLLGAGAVYYHLERYYSDSEEPLKYDAALDHFVERIASDLTKPTNHHNMWEGHIGRFLSLESAPELAFAKGPVYMCDLLKVVSWKVNCFGCLD